MKQIIQSFKTGKMEVAEVPVPQCGKGMVLVKVMSSLISAGTEKMLVDFSKKSMLGKAKDRPDLVKQVIRKMRQEGAISTVKKVFNKLDTPIPLGYSAAGMVVAVGEGVNDIKVGERVAIAGAGYANHAEYDVVPRNLLNPIPKSVSYEDAAFTTVASIGLQGIRKAAPTLGERVAVLGLGLIGQLTVMMLKGNGCRVVGFDPDPSKVELALKNGADVAVSSDIEQVALDFSKGYGVDSAIITASAKSNAPIVTAGEIVKQKGIVVMVGLTAMDIPRDLYYKKELEFKMATSYGPGRYDPTYEEGGLDYPFSFVRWTEGRNMEAFLEMIEDGIVNLETLKTHRFDIEKAHDAYGMIDEGKEPYIGVLLTYRNNNEDTTIEKPKAIRLKEKAKSGKKLNVGFIGCGNFAQAVLMPTFIKNKKVNPKAIVSRSGYSAYSSGKKFDVEMVYPDIDEMLEKEKIDAVVISTRHNLHADQIVKALEKNIHVFVEKPMALNIDELKKIHKAHKESSAVLQVGFNRRFSPFVEKMKKEIPPSGPMMIHYDVNAGVIPSDVWIHDPEVGGGRIVGEGCHFIDLISAISDSPVKEVFASAISSDSSSYRSDDNVMATVTLANGHVAHFSYHAMGGKSLSKEKIHVTSGTKSMLLDNFRALHVFGDSEKKHSSMAQEKGFKEEVEAFINGIGAGSPAISFESVINTTLATFAIEESIRKGEKVSVEEMERELFGI